MTVNKPCYVCGNTIETETEFGFSSKVEFSERIYFHLLCAQNGDPKTIEEFSQQ